MLGVEAALLLALTGLGSHCHRSTGMYTVHLSGGEVI